MQRLKQVGYALALIVPVTFAGCSTTKPEPVYAEVPGVSPSFSSTEPAPVAATPEAKSAPVQEEAAPPQVSEPKPELIVTPDESQTGSIVSVNDVGRFVVLNFPSGHVPAVNTKLFAYRQGLKVAELVVTGPQKDDHTIADIRTGECRPKDDVRDR